MKDSLVKRRNGKKNIDFYRGVGDNADFCFFGKRIRPKCAEEGEEKAARTDIVYRKEYPSPAILSYVRRI